MPKTIIDMNKRKPKFSFFSRSKVVQVESESKFLVFDFKDRILSSMFRSNSEKFSMLVPCPEHQLDVCFVWIRIEGQGILDVRTLLEHLWLSLSITSRSMPSTLTETSSTIICSNTSSMITSSGDGICFTRLISSLTSGQGIRVTSWGSQVIHN